MKAVLRGIRITPKKANLVAGMVRGMPVKEAINLLKFTPKKGAHIISKVIASAAANAKNNFHQSVDDLIITQIWAVKGATLKRATPANRGRAWPIHEVMSHITVEVGLPEGMIPKKPVAKVDAKVEKAEAKVETKEVKAEDKTAKKPVAKKPIAKPSSAKATEANKKETKSTK
jgi:large subunit ribosomal protein L22